MQAGGVLDVDAMCCTSGIIDACGVCNGNNRTCPAQISFYLQGHLFSEDGSEFNSSAWEQAAEGSIMRALSIDGRNYPAQLLNITYQSELYYTNVHISVRLPSLGMIRASTFGTNN
jgi:hypothetical protein